jgi:hypothetical protein
MKVGSQMEGDFRRGNLCWGIFLGLGDHRSEGSCPRLNGRIEKRERMGKINKRAETLQLAHNIITEIIID